MSGCNFESLLKLVDKQLDIDSKLVVFDHLDQCYNCRDAVYHIQRDRDESFFMARQPKMPPVVLR